MTDQATAFQRLTENVCQRAFSSPESLIYEFGIAPTLCRSVIRVIAERMTGSSVLDIGCGGGQIAMELAEATGRTVIGVDLSAAQTKRFARRSARTASAMPVLASADNLPFSDQSFDGVVSSCALKHWPDPRRGLDECVRVARRGSRIVIVEIDGEATAEEVRVFAQSTRIPWGMRAAYTRFAMRTVVGVAPSKDELAELLSAVGVTSLSVHDIEATPFLVAHFNAP